VSRAAALAGALVLWAAITHGNRWLGVVNPVLLPTPLEAGASRWSWAAAASCSATS